MKEIVEISLYPHQKVKNDKKDILKKKDK
jgi:hypothetical protein